MKWGFNELYNQFLHIQTGTFFTYWVLIAHKRLLDKEIFDIRLLLVGFTIGLLVEIYQYFFQDKRELHLSDRTRDIVFYIIGSALIWLI